MSAHSTDGRSLELLLKSLDKAEKECLLAIEQANTLSQLTAVDHKYLSKKGEFTQLLSGLRNLTPEERPVVGAHANKAKQKIDESFQVKKEAFESKALEEKLNAEKIDITLPSRKPPAGSLHPITKTLQEMISIFKRLGFDLAEGPEVETEFNNFDALNIPADHPARDMQDTFYLKTDEGSASCLLRTHTSPVQVRTMLAQKPPVRIICPGAVFRSDYDMTHSPMFHQVEGLYVDQNVSFAELKGCLLYFAKEMFGSQTQVRLRPSFFPFVEPGAEVDCTCLLCKGKGGECRVCKGTGWLEILGAGMVHPNVFKAVGYDPEKITGFAFGMGVERVAMLKFGIPDLRMLFENDVRFLRQFGV